MAARACDHLDGITIVKHPHERVCETCIWLYCYPDDLMREY